LQRSVDLLAAEEAVGQPRKQEGQQGESSGGVSAEENGGLDVVGSMRVSVGENGLLAAEVARALLLANCYWSRALPMKLLSKCLRHACHMQHAFVCVYERRCPLFVRKRGMLGKACLENVWVYTSNRSMHLLCVDFSFRSLSGIVSPYIYLCE
jgi:hypothetical protein